MALAQRLHGLRRSFLVCLILLAGVLLARSPARADAVSSSQPPFTLEDRAAHTRFKSIQKQQYGGIVFYEITFNPSTSKLHEGPWKVVVSYNNRTHAWIALRATVVHKGPGFTFPREATDYCLSFNSRSCGSKLCMDTNFGDLDVRYELPTRLGTLELVDAAVLDVAQTADELYDDLLPLCGPATPSTAPSVTPSVTPSQPLPPDSGLPKQGLVPTH